MILICIKLQLSNIWSSVYEKIKQQWGWVEKKALSIKKRVCHDNPLHNFLKIWRKNWLCLCPFRDFHFLWLRFFKIFTFHFHYFALLYRFTSTMFSYPIFNFFHPSGGLQDPQELQFAHSYSFLCFSCSKFSE